MGLSIKKGFLMGNGELLDKIDFTKADPKDMYYHIEHFPELCETAFQTTKKVTLPSYFLKCKKIILVGMGGSGQAGDIAKSLLTETTDLIVESIHNYVLPSFVDKDTLVIANSYSGNTEETLAAFVSAYEKGAKLIAICTGGKLQTLADKYKAPTFIFDYKSPPRAAFPYLFISLLSVFAKLGYIKLDEEMVEKSIELLEISKEKFLASVPFSQNHAKLLAEKIYKKIPVVYASEKLSGVAARIKAAFNENSKNFAFNEEFPELNHKSLEGLLNPAGVCFVLMLQSNFDQQRNIMRENITAEVLEKGHVSYEQVKFMQANDWLSETLLMVMYGDFVSYYLAVLNHANPGINDLVDYLKERLA